MAVFWAVVIFGIVLAVRATKAPRQPDEESALRIFDERLARGEIDGEEYEGRRRVPESGR